MLPRAKQKYLFYPQTGVKNMDEWQKKSHSPGIAGPGGSLFWRRGVFA